MSPQILLRSLVSLQRIILLFFAVSLENRLETVVSYAP